MFKCYMCQEGAIRISACGDFEVSFVSKENSDSTASLTLEKAESEYRIQITGASSISYSGSEDIWGNSGTAGGKRANELTFQVYAISTSAGGQEVLKIDNNVVFEIKFKARNENEFIKMIEIIKSDATIDSINLSAGRRFDSR